MLYRSPSQNQEQFQAFTDGFELMISKMAAENPYCVIMREDFNCEEMILKIKREGFLNL